MSVLAQVLTFMKSFPDQPAERSYRNSISRNQDQEPTSMRCWLLSGSVFAGHVTTSSHSIPNLRRKKDTNEGNRKENK